MVSCMCLKVLYTQYHIYRCRVQGVLAYTSCHTFHRLYTVSCICRKRPTERDQRKETYKCEETFTRNLLALLQTWDRWLSPGTYTAKETHTKRPTQRDLQKETDPCKKRPTHVIYLLSCKLWGRWLPTGMYMAKKTHTKSPTQRDPHKESWRCEKRPTYGM